MCRRRLWKWVTLSTEAPLGNLGISLYREFWEITEVGLWKRSLSMGALRREPGGGGAPSLETPKDMLNKVLEMGVYFHRGPVLGNIGGDATFLGPSREGWDFLSGECYWGIRETCKRRFWKRATLSIGDPVGEPEGGSFTGTFERNRKEGSVNEASLIKLIWAPFFDPDYVRSLSLGAVWNFSIKDQGFHDWASEYGGKKGLF